MVRTEPITENAPFFNRSIPGKIVAAKLNYASPNHNFICALVLIDIKIARLLFQWSVFIWSCIQHIRPVLLFPFKKPSSNPSINTSIIMRHSLITIILFGILIANCFVSIFILWKRHFPQRKAHNFNKPIYLRLEKCRRLKRVWWECWTSARLEKRHPMRTFKDLWRIKYHKAETANASWPAYLRKREM